jgi:hypothetical protein
MRGKLGNWRALEGLNCGGYDDLFHLGCLWTLVLIGVGGSVIMYGGFIYNLVVIFSNFDSRFGISIVVFLWCMHNICTTSVSMRGFLFSSGGMVGSVYIMVLGGKYMMTCISSNIVLYGASIVIHSSYGMVRIVIVSWFSFAVSWAQCMVFCIFSLLCGWAYPLSSHFCLKAIPLDPNMESFWNGE